MGGVSRIQVRGFKSLRDVTLEPGRVTVLVGPNGAGKSNLLAFLRLLPRLASSSLQSYVFQLGGASRLFHHGPKRTPRASFRVDFTGDAGADHAYSAELVYGAGDRVALENEYVHRREAPGWREESVGSSGAESSLPRLVDASGHTGMTEVLAYLRGMGFFHFHDTSSGSVLRQAAAGDQGRYVRWDGHHLPALLHRLSRSSAPDDRAAWERIQRIMRRIAPSIAQLRPVPADPNDASDPPSRVQLDWTDDQGTEFGVGDLSDGTLRALALVTALAQPPATIPRFVTIDEPELGLHPAALALFAGLVRSVSQRCQVVLATQSPMLLNHFEAEDVVVVERDDGATVLRRLDADALAPWLEQYSLAEAFEKNLLGGCP